MLRKKPSAPEPLELLFMLVDSCMPRLSPNAWKVVTYVAAQHLRVHPELLECTQDPGLFFLGQDLEKVGIIDSSGRSGERPYRLVSDGPNVPGQPGRARFAVISLNELCHGLRIKRGWRDRGTGLSKSSVAQAIKEALQSGILVREHQHSERGRDLSSLYAIDWDRVQEYDWERRKGPKKVSKLRTPDSGDHNANKA
jgi:hypothetical protein